MKALMKVLLLGGTRDAINIAHALLALRDSGDQNIELIYSIAGIVRQPKINCKIHTGGFSQFSTGTVSSASQQGMKRFMQQNSIDKVIDATHPYAVTISNNASVVCKLLNIPFLKYVRPAWLATEDDNWVEVMNWAEAKKTMHPFKRPFITIGRIANNDINEIPGHQHWVIRSAIEENQIQDRYRLIKAIGPFVKEQEIELLKTLQVDVVVCKNSGGSAVDGKLSAARELNLPVIMLSRPKTRRSYGNLYDNERDLIKAIR